MFGVLHYNSISHGLYFGYPNLNCTFHAIYNLHYKPTIHTNIKISSETELKLKDTRRQWQSWCLRTKLYHSYTLPSSVVASSLFTVYCKDAALANSGCLLYLQQETATHCSVRVFIDYEWPFTLILQIKYWALY